LRSAYTLRRFNVADRYLATSLGKATSAGLLKERGGFASILRDADTMLKQSAKIEATFYVSTVTGLLKQGGSFGCVLGNA
jgi:hypothetical protein